MWREACMQTEMLLCQAGRCQTLGQKACSGRSRQCHLLHMSFHHYTGVRSIQDPTHQTLTQSHTVGPDTHVIDSCLHVGVTQMLQIVFLLQLGSKKWWRDVLHCNLKIKQVLPIELWKYVVQFQLQCWKPAGKGSCNKTKGCDFTASRLCKVVRQRRVGMQTGPEAA